MESLRTETVNRPHAARYKAVNATWPIHTLPPLTAAEAISAFRMLYRHRFEKSWPGLVIAVNGAHRRSHSGYSKIVKGKRVAVFNVAPDQGWHDFIHDLSHWVHRRQYPGQNPHKGGCHAAIEMDLIEQVVNRGWLDGQLKRRAQPEKEKPDVRRIRADAVAKRIKAWTSKLKRAETALRKLNRQARYYERALGA